MAKGLRQFATRSSWRPGARIFTGRVLRDASGSSPCLTCEVTERGSVIGRTGGNRLADGSASWEPTASAAEAGRRSDVTKLRCYRALYPAAVWTGKGNSLSSTRSSPCVKITS